MLIPQKKKTILLVTFLLFIGVFSIVSVAATPKTDNLRKTRTVFTIDCSFAARSIYTDGQLTETGIYTFSNVELTSNIDVNSGSSITGVVWTKMSGTYDFNTGLGSFNGKWTFATTRGVFEGNLVGSVNFARVSGKIVGREINNQEKITGSFEATVSNYVAHIVLQGELVTK